MSEINFNFDNSSIYQKICGKNETNLDYIEQELQVKLIARGLNIKINGTEDHCLLANNIIHTLSDYISDKDEKFEFDRYDLRFIIQKSLAGDKIKAKDIDNLKIIIPESKKTVLPKSLTQALYVSEIQKKPITFGIGPAGTGKTYLAVACALKEFYNSKVSRIILTRPAVEAGESLGYLPGDFMQKVNPYLRPLYDALFDLVSFEKITELIEKNMIEIAPLAYMRGRTLNNAFVILDEAQNTTLAQMKMFLTRLGNNSKMVISGDITQIDIDKPAQSGLLKVEGLLKNINEISFIKFSHKDICRHAVVEKIVSAFEKSGAK